MRNGVRSIEHGNLADQEAIDLIKQQGAFLVPTLIIFKALAEEGVADGLPPELVGKIGKHDGAAAWRWSSRRIVPACRWRMAPT